MNELSVITFAALLIISTLGMVVTVSAERTAGELVADAVTLVEPLADIETMEYPAPAEILVINSIDSHPDTKSQTEPVVVNANLTQQIKKTIITLLAAPSSPRNTSQLQNSALVISTATNQVESFNAMFAQRVFTLTNQYRTEEGLTALNTSPTLNINATSYSAYMLANKLMNHTDLFGCDLACRFLRDGYTARSWGENLAHYSFSEEPTVEEVAQFFMREWKKSAGHRANLVSPVFTETGIGISRNNNSIYVAVHFSLPL